MQTITLSREQTEDWDASENCDDICQLACQQCDNWGEPCQVLAYDGTVLYTAQPSPLCRACCEIPAATDSHDPRYCWPCLREFSEQWSLSRTAPFDE